MKSYLIHCFITYGSGERVSLEIERILKSIGFKVTYVTNSKSIQRKCSELFGLPSDYDVIEISSFLEAVLSLTGRFTRLRRYYLKGV